MDLLTHAELSEYMSQLAKHNEAQAKAAAQKR
jgi:hypothetical protein